jgi:hypothetical protein
VHGGPEIIALHEVRPRAAGQFELVQHAPILERSAVAIKKPARGRLCERLHCC